MYGLLFQLHLLRVGIVFYKTQKTLKKYEREFAKEINELSVEKRKSVVENSKIASQVFRLTVKQSKAVNASKKS